MAAEWLDSLPAAEPDADAEAEEGGNHNGAVVGQGAGLDAEAGGDLAWLCDAGFEEAMARRALARAGGDLDEALRSLGENSRDGRGSLGEVVAGDPASGSPLPKRPRLAEQGEPGVGEVLVEGFRCVVRGPSLRLRLPQLDGLEGPEVGRLNRDGSVAFHGVDEWAEELLHAFVPRLLPSDVDGCATLPIAGFDAAAIAGIIARGEPWVCTDFASAKEVLAAHEELEALNRAGALRGADAGTTAGAGKARSDRVGFLRLGGDDDDVGADGRRPACPKACRALFRRLEAAAAALHWPCSEQLLCPNLGMASIYDAFGARYESHRDNEQLADGRWLNHRALTAIVYVNPSSFFKSGADGGQLRCHLPAGPALDVAPRGGTAVFFDARRLVHEVLPSRATRYALTLWFPVARRPAVGAV